MSQLVPFFFLNEMTYDLVLFITMIMLFISVVSLSCFGLYMLGSYTRPKGKDAIKCHHCAQQGIEVFVLPGKRCPRCNQPC